MAKKVKLKTPDWMLEGYESKAEYEKAKGISASTGGAKNGKAFVIKVCPKCRSDNIGVVLGQEEGKGKGEWMCKSCGWKGRDILKEEMSEEEFMKYLEDKGE